jgi:hypothetical protein
MSEYVRMPLEGYLKDIAKLAQQQGYIESLERSNKNLLDQNKKLMEYFSIISCERKLYPADIQRAQQAVEEDLGKAKL